MRIAHVRERNAPAGALWRLAAALPADSLLPGVAAAHTDLPVIGVPIATAPVIIPTSPTLPFSAPSCLRTRSRK